MPLTIPIEYEAVIQQAVASGEFATPEDVVKHAMELLTKERQAKKDRKIRKTAFKKERQKRLRLLEA